MSFDRVIQDSDDDEEPLGELSSERANRVPDNEVQHDMKSPGAQHATHDLHIGVNFDAFFQSSEAPQRTLSASQQQSGERWIPAGRPGSSGNTMTEIGLAQHRLFDDDQQAQFANQATALHELDQQQNPDYDMTTAEATIEAHDLHTTSFHDTLPHPHLFPHPEPSATNLSDSWSQTASYNIFDSSSHAPSAATQLNRADLIRDSTALTDPIQNFESRRWNYLQMQGVTSSPHDTEPFSSIISPKVARVDHDETDPARNIPQASSASVDELALPVTVTTEMPKVEKRGRPKKQPVPVPVSTSADDEDDELSHPQFHEPPAVKPEKRKPGRPPKAAKVALEETANAALVENPEELAPSMDENQETAVSDESQVLSHGTAINNDFPENNVEEPAEDKQIPTKPKKELKKKNLKRSKAHDSDAEDDMIVIDEQPIPQSTEPPVDEAAEQPPAPKKRGRKKKKRTEEPEQEPADAAPQSENERPTISNKDNHLELKEPRNDSGISVVLPRKPYTTRTQTPKIDTPDTTIKETLSQDQQHQHQTSPSPSNQNQPPETPQKRTDPKTPSSNGLGKHSPISSTSKVPYRVGLSKRARIAPLLKIIKR
ncbi:hypothetical protein BDV06DRAFT_129571 [Aspergillus oleicola]